MTQERFACTLCGSTEPHGPHDDRRQHLNQAGVDAIPVVTSSTPPPVPAPPSGGGYMPGPMSPAEGDAFRRHGEFDALTTWDQAVRHASEQARRTGIRQRVVRVARSNGRYWYWWRNADQATEMGA